METRGQRAIRIHEQGRPEERIRERGQLGIRIRERERQASLVAFGCETGFIGNPGQSEFLAFGRDPVGGSLVGVAVNILVPGGDVLAVRVLGVNDAGADLLLGL